jgi:glycosyltransferase involved in cell wall biosynthesis
LRILFLSSELVPERAGGIGTYTATIAPALAARGHEVHVLSCAPEHAHRDDHERGVWWHRRRLLGGSRAPEADSYRQTKLRVATAISCRSQLRSLGMRFDVIESAEWLAESLLVGATTRTPVVVNLHTPLHVLFAFDVPRFSRDLRVADALERTAVRRADRVTSTSDLLASTLRSDGWLRADAEVIGLPVDLDAWSAVTSERTGPNVLVAGRLEPRKAPEIAVEAIARLMPEVPGVSLTFAGRSRGFRDGRPYGDWLRALAESRGVQATFVGQVPHDRMAGLYSTARVVAVPSHFESFSIAALEAMASGKPVVYTSRVGAAEVLRDSNGGTQVAPGDPDALAHALRPYLMDADHAARAGAAARGVARSRCAPDIIAAQRERCFAEAIGTTHP